MALLESVIQRGLRSAQPAASTVAVGALYGVTDEKVIERSNGTAWEAYGPEAQVAVTRYRRVGFSGPISATGAIGSVQVDFAGTIVGWSVEADAVGDLAVEVSVVGGTQTTPVVPDPVTNKVSASAPIALSAAQAAGGGTAAVSTWTTAIAQWDSIGFKVTTVTTLTKATVWLRIQES